MTKISALATMSETMRVYRRNWVLYSVLIAAAGIGFRLIEYATNFAKGNVLKLALALGALIVGFVLNTYAEVATSAMYLQRESDRTPASLQAGISTAVRDGSMKLTARLAFRCFIIFLIVLFAVIVGFDILRPVLEMGLREHSLSGAGASAMGRRIGTFLGILISAGVYSRYLLVLPLFAAKTRDEADVLERAVALARPHTKMFWTMALAVSLLTLGPNHLADFGIEKLALGRLVYRVWQVADLVWIIALSVWYTIFKTIVLRQVLEEQSVAGVGEVGGLTEIGTTQAKA